MHPTCWDTHFLSPPLDAHKRAVEQREGAVGTRGWAAQPSLPCRAGDGSLRRPCARSRTLLSEGAAREGRGPRRRAKRGGVFRGGRSGPLPVTQAVLRAGSAGQPFRFTALGSFQSDSALASMSFIPVAQDCDFPLQNLPYGVFSTTGNVS